jgi:hypothetical protein
MQTGLTRTVKDYSRNTERGFMLIEFRLKSSAGHSSILLLSSSHSSEPLFIAFVASYD